MGSYGNDGKLNYEELKDNLDKIEGIENVPSIIQKLPLDVNVDGYKVTIEENGDVTVSILIPIPETIEQAKEEGRVLDKNNPVTIKDKYDNKIVVPEGFKIAQDSAEDVTGGVVIEDVSHGDTAGSQFVWVPIGEIKGENGVTKTIQLNRYSFSQNGTPTAQGENAISTYYQELATSDRGNTTAKDIEEFKISVTKNGGYYIGRYEAGDLLATTNRDNSSMKTNTAVCKQGQYVYNHVTQPEAATLSRDTYKGNSFTSDLINSYVWDTTLVFIQMFSGDGAYSTSIRLQNSLAKTGEATNGANKDVRCNIYDMAGNTYEWTTETGANPYVNRGGCYAFSSANTFPRGNYGGGDNDYTSFRVILYL